MNLVVNVKQTVPESRGAGASENRRKTAGGFARHPGLTRTGLALVLMLVVCSSTAQAVTYSCRDSGGQLHVSDTLQGLPEECRGRAVERREQDPDNLNFVPPAKQPAGSGAEFDRAVREEEQEQRLREQRAARYVQQAQHWAEQFQQARREKRQAKRSWSYQSREIIQRADRQIAEARAGKRTLLEKLDKERLPRDRVAEIRSWLQQIPSE